MALQTKGDILREGVRLGIVLEVGEVYNLGITMFNYMFSHYEVVKILSVVEHNAFSRSYLCEYADYSVGYRWDNTSHDIHIISAELPSVIRS